MRIIKEKTLIQIYQSIEYRLAKEPLKAWIYEVRKANWSNSGELKTKYKNSSILDSKRVVFNIKGNRFRLITDIEFKLGIVFIVWFGTHEEYDQINAKTIKYED
jgi:mRNA interferase HigB